MSHKTRSVLLFCGPDHTDSLWPVLTIVKSGQAQPQVCYPNPKQDMLDLKSSMCHKVSNVAKTILGVNITGKELFESIGSLSAPAPPRPFTFTSTKVNSGSKTISKSPTSKSTSPPKTSTKAVPKQSKSTN